MSKVKKMTDEEFKKLSEGIDFGDADDCDSPYTQELLDEMNEMKKKEEKK